MLMCEELVLFFDQVKDAHVSCDGEPIKAAAMLPRQGKIPSLRTFSQPYQAAVTPRSSVSLGSIAGTVKTPAIRYNRLLEPTLLPTVQYIQSLPLDQPIPDC